MAIKSFNRTVEVINDLLDKLDELPTYPLAYKGIRTNPSYLPEDPTEGDLYYVQYSDTNNEHIANYLYLRKATAWEIIATKSYTQYEIDQMFDSIGGGLHWKGAVSYYSNLPSDAELGDMWTVLYEGSSGTEQSGDEYAWGTLNGTEQWILIGKETYSKAQIDNMVDGLTDRIAIDENNILSINNAINQSQYTTPTIATGRDFTIDYGGFLIIGSICYINLRLDIVTAITSNQPMFTNLPVPLGSDSLPSGTLSTYIPNNKHLYISITNQGVLLPYNDTIQTGKILLCGAYPCINE